MKQKLPSFSINNRSYYALEHTSPFEMNFCFKIKGSLGIELLKQSTKNIFMRTPVLQTRITNIGPLTFRRLKKEKDDFNINSIFSISHTKTGDPTGIKAPINQETVLFLNDFIKTKNMLPVKFHLSVIEKNDYAFFIKLNHTVCDAVGGYILFSRIIQEYNHCQNHKNKLDIPGEPDNYSITNIKNIAKKFNPDIETADNILFYRDNNTMSGTLKCVPYLVSKNDLKKMKKAIKQSEYGFNEIMIAAVAMTYRSLNRNKNDKNLKFELLYDFREDLNIKGGLSNFIALFDIILRPEESKPLKKLLSTIQMKFRYALDNKTPLYIAAGNIKLQYTPIKKIQNKFKQFEQHMLQSNDSHITTSVTNTGSLDHLFEQPKDCVIEYTWATTQTSAVYGMKWGAATVNNNLVFNLAYNDPIILDKTADKYMKTFIKNISKIVSSTI